MVTILRMAWRNVWRNRRRSVVTIAATTLAFTVMILYSSLVEGYLRAMERNLLDLELGDLQIHSRTYRDDPSLHSSIENTGGVLDRLEGRGYDASPRLLGFGLAAGLESSAGAQIRGIDVDRDARVSRIREQVENGAWLEPTEPDGIVIGWRLARALVVAPGDEVVLLGQAADGSLANDLFRVRGVLGSVGEGIDRAGVFLTDDAFRSLFVYPTEAHEIVLRRPPAMPLDTFADEVRVLAPEARVETWRELSPTLASMLDSARSVMVVVFLIIYVAVGILVLNATLMAVFERIRELGVLKAIGFGPAQVLLIILAETTIQVGVAILVGTSLALPGLWYLETVGIDMGRLGGMAVMGTVMDPVWRGIVEPQVFTAPLLTLLSVVTLASIYPATKAAWIDPVRAMRHR